MGCIFIDDNVSLLQMFNNTVKTCSTYTAWYSSFISLSTCMLNLPSDSVVGRGSNPILERREGLITCLMECIPTLLESHISV